MSRQIRDALSELMDAVPRHGKRFQRLLNHLRDSQPDAGDPFQLMAFLMARGPESKSQLFQDLWALWVSGQKRGGFFVEFGATDGVNLSNTWLLEKTMGWQGILAEPNPGFHEALQANRACALSTKCVYSESGLQLEFLAARKGELSRIASIGLADGHDGVARIARRTLLVETISLNDLLVEQRAPERIDYLSVDTEGSELEILKAFDFDRWDVRAITVEHNYTPARDEIHGLLSQHGFQRQLEDLSLYDDWYVKVE